MDAAEVRRLAEQARIPLEAGEAETLAVELSRVLAQARILTPPASGAAADSRREEEAGGASPEPAAGEPADLRDDLPRGGPGAEEVQKLDLAGDPFFRVPGGRPGARGRSGGRA